MNKTIRLILLLLIFLATFSFGQNKIQLLNGKTKDITTYEVKGDWVFYKRADDKKDKTRRLDKFNVFSVIKADGLEEIIYDPDTSFDGDPNVDQVRRYIRGEQYSIAMYKTPWNKIESAAAGFGSGFFSFYGPAGVFINSMVLSRFNPRKIPPTTLVEPEIFNSEEFISGFNKHARNKKIKDSLTFGGIGLAVGFTFFSIIFSD